MDEGETWFPRISADLCNGCGACIVSCPTAALASLAGKANLANPDACTYCAACEPVCPAYAIELPYLICKPESMEKRTRE
jgi:ferredoxin